MKLVKICLATICLAALCGCGKKSETAAPPSPQFEAAKLEFYPADKMKILGQTHYRLIYDLNRTQMQTNISSFEQAANILGQFGWELVSSETVDGNRVYHLKRQKQPDGKFFFFPE